jgi:hypothetical protein
MSTKLAVLPRKSPSSSNRLYRTYKKRNEAKSTNMSTRLFKEKHKKVRLNIPCTYEKVHVKQKVNRKDSKEKIGSDKPPELSLRKDEIPVKVEREWCDYVDCASGSGQEGPRQVEPRYDWNVQIP